MQRRSVETTDFHVHKRSSRKCLATPSPEPTDPKPSVA
jgi:hypothetical protein